MVNIIAGAVIVAAAASAARYIISAREKGECIGCPYSESCHGKCSGKQ